MWLLLVALALCAAPVVAGAIYETQRQRHTSDRSLP